MRARPRVPVRFAIAGLLVVVLSVGLAIGRWTTGTDEAPALAPVEVVPLTSPAAPAPAAAGDPSRGRTGAVAAASTAMTTLARPELLFNADKRSAAVAEVAAPAYRQELQTQFDRAYRYMAGQIGASDSSRTVMRLVPLGYRIESFSESRAQVAVWQVLLLGAPGGQVVASWSTSRAELVWIDGRWRISRFASDEPGPGPATTNVASATPPEVFAVRVADLRSFSR